MPRSRVHVYENHDPIEYTPSDKRFAKMQTRMMCPGMCYTGNGFVGKRRIPILAWIEWTDIGEVVLSCKFAHSLLSLNNGIHRKSFQRFTRIGTEKMGGYHPCCLSDLMLSTTYRIYNDNDDVIKWKHFPRYWPFVRGIHRSPVNSPHKDQ